MQPQKLMTMLVLAFVCIMFLIYFTPVLTTAIEGATGITNEFVLAMLNIMAWLIPVAGLVGIMVGIFKLFTGGGGRRG